MVRTTVCRKKYGQPIAIFSLLVQHNPEQPGTPWLAMQGRSCFRFENYCWELNAARSPVQIIFVVDTFS